jgi:ABC-type multidrug transport system permease subunit
MAQPVGPEEGTLGDIFDFTFTKYVTPSVIKILYVLLIVFAALAYLFIVIAGFSSSFGAGIGALILGGIWVLLSILFYRVGLEIVMALFAIKQNTDKMVAQ